MASTPDHSIEQILLRKALGQPLTEAQEADLRAWTGDIGYRARIVEDLMNPVRLDSEMDLIRSTDTEALWARTGLFASRKQSFLLRLWVRYAAAAIVVLVVGGYWLTHRLSSPLPGVGTIANMVIPPGGNHAVLTLGDGSRILLDSARNGMLTQQGMARVVKLADGRIVYDGGGRRAGGTMVLNTLHTPRGGQYQLALPDGTKVWLNAASSITYPVAFDDSSRVVKMTGEAYFEVATDSKRPFRVITPASTITVLGTAFNINAYVDEEQERTTLVEGGVKVLSGSSSLRLQPGQQAVTKEKRSTLGREIDVDQVVAWKNGGFNFEGQRVQEVMRELARWYDIDVKYEGKIPDIEFGGAMGRNLELTQVLKALQYTGLTYRIENKTLIVLSK